jgi:hypothetical protein
MSEITNDQKRAAEQLAENDSDSRRRNMLTDAASFNLPPDKQEQNKGVDQSPSAELKGGFTITADPDQLIDYTFRKKGVELHAMSPVDPKIDGGPTDSTIAIKQGVIDFYEVNQNFPAAIRERVAADEVAKRSEVDKVLWGKPALDLINSHIPNVEQEAKNNPKAVDVIGVRGDLNNSPVFDLAEGKGNDLKKALDQFDANASHLKPEGGQGGENIGRIDVYVPEGAIDKINQRSESSNLRVNESTGIVETRHGDSDEWQPRLVPEESEHSQSGKSVHVWEVQIKG